jgi:hypothetical protein
MKKLFSFLLVLAVLTALVIPAVAANDTYDVKITSTIRVDEAFRDASGAPHYWWASEGKFDAVVAGKELKNITLEELSNAITEAYGIYCDYSTNQSDQYETQWEVGKTYSATIVFKTWNEATQTKDTLFTLEAEAMACETQIASVSVKPVTMYVGQEYKQLHPIITYKDGTVEPAQDGYQRDWEFPKEAGTYEYTISFSAFRDVPVTVTVLPVPTSGKCGENINWTYDAATKTLNLTGTGEMYQIAKDPDTFWAEDYDYEPPFWYCDVEAIVVGEGITKLPNFAFGHLNQKALQLPTTLKELPDYWLTVSNAMESLTIPEGITEYTGWILGSPGNSFGSLKELNLPSTLKTMDEMTVMLSGMDSRRGTVMLEKINFAGTEAQWNAITRVDSQSIKDIYGGDDYEGFYENWIKPLKEELKKIPVTFAPAQDITVSGGVASVPDSAVKVETGKDTVIDVTQAEKADSVELKAETVDKLANNQTAVEVKLPEATVTLDKTAISAINTQAGTANVTLVAKQTDKTAMSAPQTEALKDTKVHQYLSLEAKAGTTKISDFGGGKVTVSMPFAIPTGKKAADFVVAYVADNGKVTEMPTTYKDGVISFETTHFSDYIIAEKATLPNSNPKTGDVMFMPVMMLTSLLGLAICVTKRRAA